MGTWDRVMRTRGWAKEIFEQAKGTHGLVREVCGQAKLVPPDPLLRAYPCPRELIPFRPYSGSNKCNETAGQKL